MIRRGLGSTSSIAVASTSLARLHRTVTMDPSADHPTGTPRPLSEEVEPHEGHPAPHRR